MIGENLAAVTRMVDHAVIIEKGRTVRSGTSRALCGAPAVQKAHLYV